MCSSSVPLSFLSSSYNYMSHDNNAVCRQCHTHPVRCHHIVVSFHFLLDVPRDEKQRWVCSTSSVIWDALDALFNQLTQSNDMTPFVNFLPLIPSKRVHIWEIVSHWVQGYISSKSHKLKNIFPFCFCKMQYSSSDLFHTLVSEIHLHKEQVN